jgi:hypothetical protein
MTPKLAVTAASVLVAAAGLACVGPAAHANPAKRAAIRTYTEYSEVSFKGIGADKGIFTLTTGTERVVLSPHLAYKTYSYNEYTYHGLNKSVVQQVLIGNHTYTRNGGGSWAEQKVSAATRASDAHDLDLYVTRQKFDALRGVHRVSAAEFTVTGTFAQIEPFLSFEFQLTAQDFQGTGIRTLTVRFWVDSSGRPVKIDVAGHSSNTDYTTVETFGHYNEPQTISAP